MIDEAILLRELKETYTYNPDNGYFTRIKKSIGKDNVGYIAGSKRKGNNYIGLSVGGKIYNSHRVAWLCMTGSWPKDQIDHINRIKNDNRWCNLRECTALQNSRNKAPSPNNESGYKCVHWKNALKKWSAALWLDGEYVVLGFFDCKHEAARAYNAKVKEIDSEFCYLNEVPE